MVRSSDEQPTAATPQGHTAFPSTFEVCPIWKSTSPGSTSQVVQTHHPVPLSGSSSPKGCQGKSMAATVEDGRVFPWEVRSSVFGTDLTFDPTEISDSTLLQFRPHSVTFDPTETIIHNLCSKNLHFPVHIRPYLISSIRETATLCEKTNSFLQFLTSKNQL